MTDTVEGVCEKCGGGVHIGEEGEVACDGCGLSSAMCTCAGATQTTYEPLDREGRGSP